MDEAKALAIIQETCRRMPPVALEITPVVATVLIAQLRLALKHPSNTGASAKVTRHALERLLSAFPPEAQSVLQCDRFFPQVAVANICRVCGCTADNACFDARRGACSWVEEDLCSFCAEGSDGD